MTDAPHVFPQHINEYVSGCIRVEKKVVCLRNAQFTFLFFSTSHLNVFCLDYLDIAGNKYNISFSMSLLSVTRKRSRLDADKRVFYFVNYPWL